jgi:hypothetical protein
VRAWQACTEGGGGLAARALSPYCAGKVHSLPMAVFPLGLWRLGCSQLVCMYQHAAARLARAAVFRVYSLLCGIFCGQTAGMLSVSESESESDCWDALRGCLLFPERSA